MSNREFGKTLQEMLIGTQRKFERGTGNDRATLTVVKRGKGEIGWTHGSMWYGENIRDFLKAAGDGWTPLAHH
jgi:hypothetical protein